MEEKNDIPLFAKKLCSKHGLRWYDTAAGMLIDNGRERFVLKLRNGKVRKLYHENHGKTVKRKDLPCPEKDVDNKVLAKYFHDQGWHRKRIDDTLIYIIKHGSKQALLEKKREEVLAGLTQEEA